MTVKFKSVATWRIVTAFLCLPALLVSVPARANELQAFQQKATQVYQDATAKQTRLPDSAVIGAAKAKTIVIIPCLMAAEGCARPARGVQEAAEALGWKTTLIDGQGDPSKMANAVLQAISLHADAIAIQAIDADTILGPLKEARKAGIHVVGYASINRDNVVEAVYPNNNDFSAEGYAIAAGAYKLAGNKLDVIEMRGDEFGGCKLRANGTRKFIDECKAAGGDCSVLASENFLVTDLTTRVPQQAISEVRRHPNFDVLWACYDAGLNFMLQGLNSAGLTDHGIAVAMDANVANIDIIRAGGFQKATVGLPLEWVGYAQVDALNRMFLGKTPNDGGIQLKLLVQQNVPAHGAWQGDVDFRSAYRKSWGLN
jgi:ribose transport system substrate-binding protein